ncbi:MAG: cellulase family glycosylhydrolase [Actinomycetota bacterium]|nr:cellulase family glycosylhydrolase [Actinomycetota bacterium]
MKNINRTRLALLSTAVIVPTLIAAVALPLRATATTAASVPTAVANHANIDLPLSTSGGRIVDADGDTVTLQGVNWFGMETATHAPHGLWSRDYRDMLQQIAGLGFNVVRIPFSLEALGSQSTSSIDFGGNRNTALQGKTPLEVLDEIVAEAGRQGLMVILDNHSQADDGFTYDLWYGQNGYTEADWISTWQMLATRYGKVSNVVGYDLKNEPHGRATWGTGGPTDWRLAAERAGRAVLAKDSDALILVEGIESPVAGGSLDRHWWGGNLEGVRNDPVRLGVPGHVVYSPHEYGPGVFAQPWFSSPNMLSILADRWQKGFGYINASGIAPVLVGEFGAKNVTPETVEGKWITQFADYLASSGTSWTFWSWNPNSGDTGGVLKDDWRTVHADKVALLTTLMGGRTGIPAPIPAVTATPKASPSATASNGLTGRILIDSQWPTGACLRLSVTNTTTTARAITELGFDLPTGSVSSSWNGTTSRTGDRVRIVTPSWARAEAGASYSDTGVCISGSRIPAELFVNGATSASPAPSASPTTSPSASATPTSSPSVSSTPIPTVTASPSITPTIPPTQPPSPPTSANALRAALITDSVWDSGSCLTLAITNTSTSPVANWSASFTLAAGTRINQSWSGELVVEGNRALVSAPSWGGQISSGGTVRHFGFCVTGTGLPHNASAG